MKTLCCAAAIALLAASSAHADQWNKKTYLTFSGPVQIPGRTLPAGTYLFQLADPDNARHVVMVASKDGKQVYGLFLTIPNDRLQAPDENVVMFGEAPAGAPQAVQAWWYPGDRMGEEFVYPMSQAVRIAKANRREVLATETNVNASGSENERMAAVRGEKVARVDQNGRMTGESTKTAQATTTEPPTTTTAPANTVNGRNANAAKTTTARTNTAPTDTARTNTVGTAGQTNTANNTTARRNRKALPRTASNLELIELLSALSLAGAFGLRRLRRGAQTR